MEFWKPDRENRRIILLPTEANSRELHQYLTLHKVFPPQTLPCTQITGSCWICDMLSEEERREEFMESTKGFWVEA
jgi:hypothetical protein